MAEFFKKMGSKFDALKKHKLNALAHFEVPETPDEEFQASAATYHELKGNLESLDKNAKDFHHQMQTIITSMELMTQGFGATMTNEAGDAPLCDVAAGTQVVFDFRNSVQDACIQAFETSVLEPLAKKLTQIGAVEEQIAKREEFKKEYDYYYFKVSKLREKGGDSTKQQEKLQKNEEKLAEAKTSLKNASGPLIAFFQECTTLQQKIVAHEYEQFKQVQRIFFSTGVEKYETLAKAVNDFELVELPEMQADAVAEGDVTDAAQTEAAPAIPNAEDKEEAVPAAEDGAAAAASEEGGESTATDSGEGRPGIVLFDFEPQAEDELKLTAGQEIIVLAQTDNAWWEGKVNGEVGLFPASYVKLKV